MIMDKSKKRVHFLGINGSGIAGVACLAKQNEYIVSGCDLNKVGNYTTQLNEVNIDVLEGHSVEHLENIDKLVVSAAIYFKDRYKDIPEVIEAMNRNIEIVKWQTFLNDDLAKDKELISICGTHGKTTTTTFLTDLLEDLGTDPMAMVGGINKRTNRGYRSGKGKYFVCESDEYAGNFLSYYPKYTIINNIEMEHPEYFNDFDGYKNNFSNFIQNIQDNGIIIFNGDCDGCCDVINSNKDFLINKNVKIISYSLKNNKCGDFIRNIQANILDNTSFEINGEIFKLDGVYGEHNFRNCIVNIILLQELDFNNKDIKKALLNIELPKRRMEKVFDKDNIVVYDDYAHHHTQILYNLDTLRNSMNKDDKIIAILEPHLISRFRDNSDEYIKYMEIADFPIITKFYKSREQNLKDLNMDAYVKNNKVEYIEEFDDVIKQVMAILDTVKYNKMHIVVMGAGLSYILAQNIVNILNK